MRNPPPAAPGSVASGPTDPAFRVIGTAGHIDHGKTALVRALTGQDTDRLKEEKERGISIDLGFAHLDLPGIGRVGVIDVPGHERFIRNMLAGAHGIDLVLLAVAADDGVMPQTREHLDIVHLLGVQRGVVALTKTDRSDPARVAEVRDQVRRLLAGTSLAAAPCVGVSSLTGAGLDALLQALREQLANTARAGADNLFRLPVDRAFVLPGLGVVATGTAIAGTVGEGDSVRVLPSGVSARVRGVQVHGEKRATARAGERVALHLGGVELADLRRGSALADPRLERLTERIEVSIEVRPSSPRPLKNHEAVRLHLGSAELPARILFPEGGPLAPGTSALAQVSLGTPAHVLQGDRFIVRTADARRTLGGGLVLDPFAPKARATRAARKAPLEGLREATTPAARLAGLVGAQVGLVTTGEDLLQATGMDPGRFAELLEGAPGVRRLRGAAGVEAWCTEERARELGKEILRCLERLQAASALADGIEVETLRTQIQSELPAGFFRGFVAELESAGEIVRTSNRVRLPGQHPAAPGRRALLEARLIARLREAGLTPPGVRELGEEFGAEGREVVAGLRQLAGTGQAVKVVEDLWFSAEAVEAARAAVVRHLGVEREITAATLRDQLAISRKFSIALLDYFDRTGFTMRVGDARRLRR